jgi:hypothetical protein
MWMTDLLPGASKVCPTCPTCKNKVGQPQSLVSVTPSDLSDLSDQKTKRNIFPEQNRQKEEEITQVLYKNPESVRLLPETQEPVADCVLSLSDAPTEARGLGNPTPEWIRPCVPGETLDDAKERRCASPRCGAVFMRRGQDDESWGNKIRCSSECLHGKPWLPACEVLQ